MPGQDIRQLLRIRLNKEFSAEALLCVCYDSPVFNPVYSHLTTRVSKIELINRLIGYAGQTSALAELEHLKVSDDSVSTADRLSQPTQHQPERGNIPQQATSGITLSIGSNRGVISIGNNNSVHNHPDADDA